MDFTEFYEALYSQPDASQKRGPFPWQERLAARVIDHGWVAVPEDDDSENVVIDLPTASGKTTVLDIALFHLIHQLERKKERTAPLRLFFIVDRRIVVDGAFQHARRLADKLAEATGGPLKQAKELLCDHFEVERPVHVSVMRGGLFRDDGWTRSPVQPTICVSTVDQVGSRLLFRGYGVSPSMRPIHAGLVANDSLLLIDEAHLSEPFLQTLQRVRQLTRESSESPLTQRPLQFVRMSATNAESDSEPFRIDDDDRNHPVLRPRLEASKPAAFDKVKVDKDNAREADRQFCRTAVSHALRLAGLDSDGEDAPVAKKRRKEKVASETLKPAHVIGVVVNRVRTAREIHQLLFNELCPDDEDGKADVILLTGRIRPFDRDELFFRKPIHGRPGWLSWIAADREQQPDHPVFVVATQTVEVGADISFDALVTEAAPLDCLRQRFGRLDRLGRRKKSVAVILGRSTAVAKTADDPIYGPAIGTTWRWLNEIAEGSGKSKSVDFGLNAMEGHLSKLPAKSLLDMLAPRRDAPFLQKPYAEIWSRTNPAPAADPDVARFLHGNDSRPPDVQVIWRADLLNHDEEERGSQLEQQYLSDYVNAVALLPPTRMEACSVPVGELRRLLNRRSGSTDSADRLSSDLADVEGGSLVGSDDDRSPARFRRPALVWRGAKSETSGRRSAEDSRLARADEISPGDTVIIPTSYGGYDEFGWRPASDKKVPDVAESCVRWSRGLPVLRLHHDVISGWPSGCSSDPPALPGSDSPDAITEFLNDLAQIEGLPDAVAKTINGLRAPTSRRSIPYEIEHRPQDAELPFSLVLTGRRRISIAQVLEETLNAVEDAMELDDMSDEDDGRSFCGLTKPALLTEHTRGTEHTPGVVAIASQFAELAGCPAEIVKDVKLAAEWHDLGKIDPRFQAMLYDGDEIEAILAISENRLRAKSAIAFNDRVARRRAKLRAGVPDNFRHEALSVMLLRHGGQSVLTAARDRDLVEYLIGTHHGFGRPFFPVCFDTQPPDLNVTWHERTWQITAPSRTQHELFRIDSEWSDLFSRLNQHYGLWGLAWLEAAFRLADHRQSASEVSEESNTSQEVTAYA